MSDAYTSGGFGHDHSGSGRSGGELDMGALVRALLRHKWTLAVVTLAVFVIALVGVNAVTPRYTGETKVLLENRDSPYTRLDRDSRNDLTIDQDAVQSQVQLIASRDLARSVVKKLGLLDNSEFDPMRQGLGPLKQFLVTLGLSRNPTTYSPEDRVLDNYNDRLQAYSVRGSRVIAVEFTSQDPKLAADGANAVADGYLKMQEQAKKDISRSAGTWLTSAIEPLRQKLAEAEAKVEAYRASTGLYNGANNTSITAQQLTELNSQLSAARSQQSDFQAKANVIRNAIKSGRLFEVSEIVNNELVRRLIENRATLRAQIAQEERTLLPSHPRMKELYAQLDGLDTQIKGAADRTARTMESDARTAGARVTSLTEELDRQKQSVGTANESEVQLRALEREAKTYRDQLESFLAKNNEAVARNVDNAVPPDARIISRAIVPDTPTFPKKGPILFITTLAALLLSCAIVVTRELVSGRAFISPQLAEPVVYAAAPVAVAADVPAAVAIAPAAEVPPAGVALDSDAAYTRAVQSIVTEIRSAKPRGRGAVILVAAPRPNSGASSTAINLGRTLVRSGRSIIAEFDRHWPSLHRLVAEHDPCGLADVIANGVGFGDAIHRDRASRLHVLPLGRNVRADVFEENAEMLSTTLDALTETYDFIVCDLGPASDASENLVKRGDLILLVARGEEDEPQTIDAYHVLRDRGAKTISVILTPAQPFIAANDEAHMQPGVA